MPLLGLQISFAKGGDVRTFIGLAISACLVLSAGCTPSTADRDRSVDLTGATEVKLWATRYYTYEAVAVPGSGGIPLRDMQDRVIGPSLSERDWCAAALEGTVRVDGRTYNYAGVKSPPQADCAYRPSRTVRWVLTQYPLGLGSNDNPLVPYRTLACDQGRVVGSTPWLNGGYARFGQRIYIPAAEGTLLPDGTVHDGLFTCGDIGAPITGNHVDVFIGPARGEQDAARRDPFNFIGSRPSALFTAYVLP